MSVLFVIGFAEVLGFVFLVVAYRRLREMQQKTVAQYADATQKNKDATYAVTVATTPELVEALRPVAQPRGAYAQLQTVKDGRAVGT
jgi:hypothetical protein